jgi:CRP/FNR family cyclic AMP-dependent transcriptional regulator
MVDLLQECGAVMALSLKHIPLFRGLREDELRALAAQAVTQSLPKNSIVVREGEFTQSLYVILSGKVTIFLKAESGKELVLDVKGPREYFGAMMLDDGPGSASIITRRPSKFAVISMADFRKFLLDHPTIALRVIRNLIQIARGLNQNVRSLMLGVYTRVARMLLDLAVTRGGKLVIPEQLTQRELAARAGTSREMINRIFKNLSAGKYIKIDAGKITILKPLPHDWK